MVTATEKNTAPKPRPPLVRREPVTPDPWIAVVIPVYKQPHYLPDSVISALRQSLRDRIRVVIVNDGCPLGETDALCREFADAFPDEVFYLKKPNGGLSSARNAGIRFALEAWPSLRAVFPLDADNKLSPRTIQLLWAKLEGSPAELGWAANDLSLFGTEDGVWHTGLPFSLYRLLHENFCDAGSLIRREVFDSGIWYDESMRAGYEDWEFFIHTAVRGFRGGHVPNSGFLYRRHGISMLTGAKGKHEAIYSYIRAKHAGKLTPDALCALEHAEVPRYALVDVATQTVSYVTNAIAEGEPTRPFSEFAAELVSWATEPPMKSTYVPPIVVLFTAESRGLLTDLRVLPSLLLLLQHSLRQKDYAALTLEVADSPTALEVAPGRGDGHVALLALTSHKWLELKKAFGDRLGDQFLRGNLLKGDCSRLRVGVSHFDGGRGRMLSTLCTAIRAQPEACWRRSLGPIIDLLDQPDGELRWSRDSNSGSSLYMTSHTEWGWWRNVEADERSLFPYFDAPREGRSPIHVFFVAPWIRLGGVDQIVLNLSERLAQLGDRYRAHLVVTDGSDVEADPRWLGFTTINFLPHDPASRRQTLLEILSSADVVVNHQSMPCYEILPELKRTRAVKYFSALQLIDLDHRGLPCGYPIIASRQYEGLIDRYLVPSKRLARSCANMGVPGEKLVFLRNAPVVFPATREQAHAIAREKCRRSYSARNPLRILFSGRFDHQKGFDRLERIAGRLHAARIPYELRIVGKPVIPGGSDAAAIARIANTTLLPSTTDRALLARYYTEADVYLLPSRFEGVPLAVIEAMSFANLVVTTDVGATSEFLEHGTSGFLVDPYQSEEEIAAAVERIIHAIVKKPRQYDDLRKRASAEGRKYLWTDAAADLARVIESTLGRAAEH